MMKNDIKICVKMCFKNCKKNYVLTNYAFQVGYVLLYDTLIFDIFVFFSNLNKNKNKYNIKNDDF